MAGRIRIPGLCGGVVGCLAHRCNDLLGAHERVVGLAERVLARQVDAVEDQQRDERHQQRQQQEGKWWPLATVGEALLSAHRRH